MEQNESNVIAYCFCMENTKFNGWEKHMGRKNMDKKHTDEKTQTSMVGKSGRKSHRKNKNEKHTK